METKCFYTCSVDKGFAKEGLLLFFLEKGYRRFGNVAYEHQIVFRNNAEWLYKKLLFNMQFKCVS